MKLQKYVRNKDKQKLKQSVYNACALTKDANTHKNKCTHTIVCMYACHYTVLSDLENLTDRLHCLDYNRNLTPLSLAYLNRLLTSRSYFFFFISRTVLRRLHLFTQCPDPLTELILYATSGYQQSACGVVTICCTLGQSQPRQLVIVCAFRSC